ncbi:MAG: hypothetical protein A2481_03255 [Candidatus Yonathbacteria bacterium RIFOXYC2_FULL_47_9]|nr:MAG: hypothetical protein A2481_03255 [Candidatus Yonathbacteria bacterium RIFOXYC2_FULL_47_9]HAT68390.1 hypothetical protein [Candidatus Yonathbacteria bacterium]
MVVKMKIKNFLVIVACFFSPISFLNASSIKGTSLGEFSSCDYYLIEDISGDYSLVEWYGGGLTPDSGDIVVGELHSYGFKDLYNITRDNSTRVWIDDYMLSEDSATEKLIDKCGWDRSILNYFSGGSSGYSSYYSTPNLTPPPPVYCPANSTLNSVDLKCYCNSGYILNGNMCTVSTNFSPYQNIVDHKIYREVRIAYAYNSDKGCENLSLVGEDLAMCRAFASDSNKDGWLTIEKPDKTVTVQSLLEKQSLQNKNEPQNIVVASPGLSGVQTPMESLKNQDSKKQKEMDTPNEFLTIPKEAKLSATDVLLKESFKNVHKTEKEEVANNLIQASTTLLKSEPKEAPVVRHWYSWFNPFSWFK